jgi:hypothetical protein
MRPNARPDTSSRCARPSQRQPQRSLIHGGREGVVRQGQNPARSRNIRHGAQVCDFQTRVTWRLDQEQPRRRRDRALPCASVGLIDERVVHPEAREQLLDKAERTPVHAALSHDVIGAGVPEHIAQMNTQALALLAEGDSDWITQDLPTILGRPARSFEQFAADHAAAFS